MRAGYVLERALVVMSIKLSIPTAYISFSNSELVMMNKVVWLIMLGIVSGAVMEDRCENIVSVL